MIKRVRRIAGPYRWLLLGAGIGLLVILGMNHWVSGRLRRLLAYPGSTIETYGEAAPVALLIAITADPPGQVQGFYRQKWEVTQPRRGRPKPVSLLHIKRTQQTWSGIPTLIIELITLVTIPHGQGTIIQIHYMTYQVHQHLN